MAFAMLKAANQRWGSMLISAATYEYAHLPWVQDLL